MPQVSLFSYGPFHQPSLGTCSTAPWGVLGVGLAHGLTRPLELGPTYHANLEQSGRAYLMQGILILRMYTVSPSHNALHAVQTQTVGMGTH